MGFLAAYLVLLSVGGSLAFHPFLTSVSKHFDGDAGPKLKFSQYIKEGRVKEARDLSLVTGLTPNITSYSGYFNVNEECDSNLFFWFFPSQNDPESDPVVIWLEGGPGTSSLFALLVELGPYDLGMDGTLGLREYSWNRNASLIFVDNPVGTGYSYTGSEDCYATNQTQVGQEILTALEQFFEVFPEYKSNEFYVTGQSFGGHYVPAVAYAIHNSNSTINLKGLAIGNGWTDPENQLLYSSQVYQLGLIDNSTRAKIATYEQYARSNISSGNYEEATAIWNLILGDFIAGASGYTQPYNFLFSDGEPIPDYAEFVTRKEVREAIHVGNATWSEVGLVYDKLWDDISRSYRPWLETLLDNYKVLIYNGQLDIIVAYALTEGYMQKLQWKGAEEYQNAQRKIWYVGDDLAGYAKSSGNFTEVLVRNAGHMVPVNQPVWGFDLISRFLNNQPIGSK